MPGRRIAAIRALFAETGVREVCLSVFTALAIYIVLTATGPSLLRSMETASLDLRFRLRGVEPPGADLAVVLVDDRSIDMLGRWPLSHRLYAKAIDTLDRAGARVIVFDLLFAQPEEPIPADLRKAARTAAAALPESGDGALRAALEQLAEDDPDGDFAEAIRRSGHVYLPIAFAFTGTAVEAPDFVSAAGYQAFDKSVARAVFPLKPVSAVTPLPVWGTVAAGLGHVNIAYDRDGAPRYDYLALPFQGDFLPSLPVRVAAAYLGVPWNKVALGLGEHVRIGQITVPADASMRMLVDYRGPRGTFPTYSFVDLIEGKVPAAALAGRIVLIGASFLGLPDAYASPFGTVLMPGTERMANAIDTILHRRFLIESPAPWPLLVIVFVGLLAALTGAMSAFLPTRSAILVGPLPLVLWAFGAQYAFDRDLWLPLVAPAVALGAAMVAVLLFRYWIVDAEGRSVKSAFRYYLAPDMVDVLARHPERLQLGGETRAITVLFSDIRGFTSIAEQYKSNPAGLSRLINRGFLSPMTDLIMAGHGTIDKYMGDCVMAFWNAPLDDPDHADHACAAAVAMVAAMERINAELEAEAAAEGRPFAELRIGIGLNTGDCVVGNMGSSQRFAYTALGDAVNLASRLEGQTKTYGVDIVIGQETHKTAPGWAALELDWISVKGKVDADSIYTLLGDASFAESREFKTLSARHAAMLSCYRRQDWVGALAALRRCRQSEIAPTHLYNLYEERILHYQEHPPGPSWDGVFIAHDK